MKKFLPVLLLSVFGAFAQTTPLMRTYTVTNAVPGGMNIRSLWLNNCLYNAYWEPQGIVIQKNDADGVPLLKKMVNAIAQTPASKLYLNTGGANIYISGTRTTAQGTVTSQMPFLIAVDTASCSLVYFRDYTVTAGFNTATIYESKMLSNGNLLWAGSITNAGGSNSSYGLFMSVNASGGGNLAYTNTLSIQGSTLNTILSFAEISNSSIIYSAYSGSNILGKMFKTNGSMNTAAAFMVNPGIGSVESYSNPKKVWVHGQNYVYKTDTSLNINDVSLFFAGSSNLSVYKNDRIYRIYNGNAKLEIIDSSLAIVSSMSYSNALSGLPAVFAQSMAKNSNNLYFNVADTVSSKNFYLVKTGLAGQMNCSSQLASNPSSISVIGMQVNALSASVTAQSNSLAPLMNTYTVAHVPSCINVGVKELPNHGGYRLAMADGIYYLQTETNIMKMEIYDLTGKMLRKENCNGTNVPVDLSGLPKGIYIGRATDVNKSEFTFKLVN